MNILVTGGNSGIGFEIVIEFIRKGFFVTVLDKNLTKLTPINHDKLSCIEIDLSNKNTVMEWLKNNEVFFDVVINCAGIREIISVLELSIPDWEKILTVNLTVPFVISQYVAQQAIIKKKTTNIINVSSISGLQGEPNRAAYCASKHGLIGLTKEMAIELGRYNIRVNAIAPGIIETELTNEYFKNEKIVELIEKNTPLARWGKPSNVVSGINFILENEFVTGSVLVIDGGWMAGKEL